MSQRRVLRFAVTGALLGFVACDGEAKDQPRTVDPPKPKTSDEGPRDFAPNPGPDEVERGKPVVPDDAGSAPDQPEVDSSPDSNPDGAIPDIELGARVNPGREPEPEPKPEPDTAARVNPGPEVTKPEPAPEAKGDVKVRLNTAREPDPPTP